MRLIDPDHPFFRPAWRRYLVVLAPLVWAGVEAYLGNMVWSFVFGASSAYLAWYLVLNWQQGGKG